MKEAKNEIHSTGLQGSGNKQPPAISTSMPISVSLAEYLFSLAKEVTKTEKTPRTARAACECAREIHRLLDLQQKAKNRV